MLTNAQLHGAMERLILSGLEDETTKQMLELLHEVLSWRELYPTVTLRRATWDVVTKKFVDSH